MLKLDVRALKRRERSRKSSKISEMTSLTFLISFDRVLLRHSTSPKASLARYFSQLSRSSLLFLIQLMLLLPSIKEFLCREREEKISLPLASQRSLHSTRWHVLDQFSDMSP